MWKPIELENVHKGVIGFVEFRMNDMPTMIVCEIVDMRGEKVEIVAVASDRTCFWIPRTRFLIRYEA